MTFGIFFLKITKIQGFLVFYDKNEVFKSHLQLLAYYITTATMTLTAFSCCDEKLNDF